MDASKNIWFCFIKNVCFWILFSAYVSISILKTSLCVLTGLKKIEKSKWFWFLSKKNLGGTLFYCFWSYRVLWLLTNKDSILQFYSYVVNLYFWKSVFVVFCLYCTKCLLLWNCCPKFLSNLKRLFRQCDFYSIKEFVISLCFCNKFYFCRPILKKWDFPWIVIF